MVYKKQPVMLPTITDKIIKETLAKAKGFPRRRAIYCLHQPDDQLRRMVNAAYFDTYIRPHKHENPDKLETFTILDGRVAVVEFDNSGKIIDSVILDHLGSSNHVEVPPRTWHSLVILSESAAVYEFSDMGYDPKTHKKEAPWAPPENSEKAKQYLEYLKDIILDF